VVHGVPLMGSAGSGKAARDACDASAQETHSEGRDDEAALAATVGRLRDEVDGLRQAMRSRAVIEQAKGMMMERHGITNDEAFERLARLSQRANVKLVDVAAALVGTPSGQPANAERTPGPDQAGRTRGAGDTERPGDQDRPGDTGLAQPSPADIARTVREQLDRRWPSQPSGGTEFGRRIRAQGRGARIRAELMAATAPADVLNAVTGTASGEHPPDAAVLAVLDVNGVLRMISSRGIPSPVAARWRDLPVDLPLLGCLAARTGEPQWLADSPVDGTAIGFGLSGTFASVALLPLTDVGSRGILALAWTRPRPLDDPARTELSRLAAAVSVAVSRLPGTAGPGADEVARAAADPTVAVLDVLYAAVILCEPVPGPHGGIDDLRLLHANPAATDHRGRTITGQTGRSVLELLPDVVGTGLLRVCEQVWRSGAQAELVQQRRRLVVNGKERIGWCDVRVTRYRDGLLITWSLPQADEQLTELVRPQVARGPARQERP
jgi:hypothetical protein